jgi:hypothetical protein
MKSHPNTVFRVLSLGRPAPIPPPEFIWDVLSE